MEPVEPSELRSAIENDQPERARALLAQGADPNADEGYGVPLLHHAIDIEADTYQNRGVVADGRLVTILLEAGADPAALDRRGDTALKWACELGHDRAVILLKGHGATG